MPRLARPTASTLAEAVAPLMTSSLVLRRAGVNLAAQLCQVGLLPGSAGNPEQLGAGATAVFVTEVIGSADFDIERGDLFVWGGTQYRVTLVEPTVGSVQGDTFTRALAEAGQG